MFCCCEEEWGEVKGLLDTEGGADSGTSELYKCDEGVGPAE
jgi:hypothetical protein